MHCIPHSFSSCKSAWCSWKVCVHAESHVIDFFFYQKICSSCCTVSRRNWDLQDSVQICIFKIEEGYHLACKPFYFPLQTQNQWISTYQRHKVAAVAPQQFLYQYPVAQYLRITAFCKNRLEVLSWYSAGQLGIAVIMFTVR